MKKKRLLGTMAVLAASLTAYANTTVTSEQVTGEVTVSDDVDYVITNASPFADAGKVNITNTEHAVVIIQNVRPSVVISKWLRGHVLINGKQAVNNSNCQVKMYAQGAIIMPYASNIKPLTVYSEQNFGGTSVNDFGLENDGGYMNTLTDAKLNNKIRSFKLKRGYMVTFSTRAGGRGYSRCFIADKEDLEIATLPTVLDQRITSYRVFQWYDAQKKGLASDTRETENGLINSSWCYDWGTGVNRLPDTECVPNHIYEDWPSSAACGSVTYACHMKTNNEPGNKSDDHPQSVETVLANWENLMRTGLRLCSESSHDGSLNHLKAFIDSIDARGWRCDLVDLHCYWPSSNFNNWKYWYDRFGQRPIWISEWVWGASWNNNGIFATDRTYSTANQQKNADELKKIIPWMNASPYVERYAYWNSEADCSKIIKDGKLSIAGEYYASVEPGLAYNRNYEKIPALPPQKNPSALAIEYSAEDNTVSLSWHDYNGEYNQSMDIQCKAVGSSIWKTVKTVDQLENAADYNVKIEGLDGNKYRIRIKDLTGKDRLTNEATAVNENLNFGDGVTIVESGTAKTKYLGGNMLVNGSFDFGMTDWTNAAGTPLAAPYYQVVKKGGVDGGNYLQCYGSSDSKTSEQSIVRKMALEENASYYVAASGCNTNADNQRILTGTESFALTQRVALPSVAEWGSVGASFTTNTDNVLYIQMLKLGGTAMLDNVIVSRLFDTKEDALADAKQWETKRFAAFKAFNTTLPKLNELMQAYMDEAGVNARDMESMIQSGLKCIATRNVVDSLAADVKLVVDNNLTNADVISEKYAALKNFAYADVNTYLEDLAALKTMVAEALPATLVTDKVQNPSFAATANWNVKAGTYTDGDQRTNTVSGKTCWNAWWSISATGNADKTMEVNQALTRLSAGFYALECKAGTQHLCENDQRAFLVIGADSIFSQPLQYGLLDLPNFSEAEQWNTVTTPYTYIDNNGSLTIGFKGSKNGAIDKQWMKYGSPSSTGDNREGWWCATDFALRYIPAVSKNPTEGEWGTICLPTTFTIPSGVKLYSVVGISADSLNIGIEEVTGEPVAGIPYLYRKDGDKKITFIQSGNSVIAPNTNQNGLRGTFVSTIKYQLGSLVLQNDKWTVVTERFPIESNSAYIYKVSNVPVLPADWSGMMLPTSGLAKPTGVNMVRADVSSKSTKNYNLSGQRVNNDAKGVIITETGKKLVR